MSFLTELGYDYPYTKPKTYLENLMLDPNEEHLRKFKAKKAYWALKEKETKIIKEMCAIKDKIYTKAYAKNFDEQVIDVMLNNYNDYVHLIPKLSNVRALMEELFPEEGVK